MFFLIILLIVLSIIYAIMIIHHELWIHDINLICKIKGHNIIDEVDYRPNEQSTPKLSKVILHTCKCKRCNIIFKQIMTFGISE